MCCHSWLIEVIGEIDSEGPSNLDFLCIGRAGQSSQANESYKRNRQVTHKNRRCLLFVLRDDVLRQCKSSTTLGMIPQQYPTKGTTALTLLLTGKSCQAYCFADRLRGTVRVGLCLGILGDSQFNRLDL